MRSGEVQLTLLTRDPRWARAADDAGVARIGVDIERRGKRRRQPERDARISDHRLEDLKAIAAVTQRAALFARLNPPHARTRFEVDRAIGCGARSLMLPWFSRPHEAESFVRAVDGRAEVCLLVETSAALARLGEISSVPGVDEVMLGLNDLHRELRLDSPFELLTSDLLRAAAATVHARGRRFGFGAVARPGSRRLPVPPELLLALFVELDVGSTWIARSFFTPALTVPRLGPELARVRARLELFRRDRRRRTAALARLRRVVEGLRGA